MRRRGMKIRKKDLRNATAVAMTLAFERSVHKDGCFDNAALDGLADAGEQIIASFVRMSPEMFEEKMGEVETYIAKMYAAKVADPAASADDTEQVFQMAAALHEFVQRVRG